MQRATDMKHWERLLGFLPTERLRAVISRRAISMSFPIAKVLKTTSRHVISMKPSAVPF
jgi:hypothetical protein